MEKFSIKDSHAFLDTFELLPKGTGPLTGLKFAVKDTLDVKGYTASNGLPKWGETFPKATRNAKVIDLLLEAGAKCIGRTRSAELTFSIDGESAFYGTPINPKDPRRIPGGSSSGSASAVSCGFVDFALGTDNAGSVRVPASYCGIFGIRPTPGIISTSGLIPFSKSFDDIGVFAKDHTVLQKVMSVLLPKKDPTSLQTIYLVKDAFDLADKKVKKALEPSIEKMGKLKEISLKEIFGGGMPPLDTWYDAIIRHVQWPEIIHSVGEFVEKEKPRLSPRIDEAIKLARELDPSGFEKAKERINSYSEILFKFLAPGNLLLFPTTPSIAPLKNTLESKEVAAKYYGRTLGICGISTVTGSPELTIPVADVNGVPTSLSLLGARHSDHLLLDFKSFY